MFLYSLMFLLLLFNVVLADAFVLLHCYFSKIISWSISADIDIHSQICFCSNYDCRRSDNLLSNVHGPALTVPTWRTVMRHLCIQSMLGLIPLYQTFMNSWTLYSCFIAFCPFGVGFLGRSVDISYKHPLFLAYPKSHEKHIETIYYCNRLFISLMFHLYKRYYMLYEDWWATGWIFVIEG